MKNEQFQEKRRNQLISKRDHWVDFRVRRDIQIKKYIQARKKQETCRLNITLSRCLIGLKNFKKYFKVQSV